jgi:uncharacterized protein
MSLLSLFWSREYGRARLPWLIALPVLGAFAVLNVVAVLLESVLPRPALALAISGSAVVAAVILVTAGRRFFGGPYSLRAYGLRVDRRWLVDLVAGLVIGGLAYSAPMLMALATGGFSVEATFDSGDLPLWPGIALMVLAMLCTGFWEELLLRGVFISHTVDGLRRRLSSVRAVAVAVALSATVFGLPHLAQPEHPALILTWILSGVVFGIIYVLSGNLALVIGAHASFNMVANILFVRSDIPGSETQSALTRVRLDADLTMLTPGGVVEITGFVLIGVLSLLWLGLRRRPGGQHVADVRLDRDLAQEQRIGELVGLDLDSRLDGGRAVRASPTSSMSAPASRIIRKPGRTTY